MSISFAAITNPISLVAYVASSVFCLLAKKWNSKNNKPLFYLAATLSVIAIFGGLFLAWDQSPKTTPSTGSAAAIQKSSGDQSPNINSSGSGAVSVQNGPAPAPSSEKPQATKK